MLHHSLLPERDISTTEHPWYLPRMAGVLKLLPAILPTVACYSVALSSSFGFLNEARKILFFPFIMVRQKMQKD